MTPDPKTEYAALDAPHFLAFAAISPLAASVVAALRRWTDAYAARGIGAVEGWLEAKERLRSGLGRLLGVGPSRLAITSSTSQGVDLIARSLRWGARDALLCFEGEFPTNVHAWRRHADRIGLRAVLEPLAAIGPDGSGLDILLERHRPRLVAVSAVQFQTGRRMPIAEMARRCHAHGALLFVDAIQAAGVVPLAVANAGIDFAAGGAHKWLLGAEGAGWLYVAEGREAHLDPAGTGWLSVEEPARFLGVEGALDYDARLRPVPQCFEGSSMSALSVVALEASVALVEAFGVEHVFGHTQRWHDAFEPLLLEEGFVSHRSSEAAERSGILSFSPPPGVTSAPLAAALRRRGVVVTTPEGLLRFAPHLVNTLDAIPDLAGRVVAALDEVRSASTG